MALRFFATLKQIGQKKTFEKLRRDHEREIVQVRGTAFHDTFGCTERQRYMWSNGPLVGLKYALDAICGFGLSGAGAIGTDGTLWKAHKNYEGVGEPWRRR